MEHTLLNDEELGVSYQNGRDSESDQNPARRKFDRDSDEKSDLYGDGAEVDVAFLSRVRTTMN